MSLIFCDGFDDGLTASKWNSIFSSHALVTSGGRNGNKLVLDDNGSGTRVVKRQFLASQAHAKMTWGFAISADTASNFDNLSSNGHLGILYGDAGATTHVAITSSYSSGAATISAYRGSASGGTLLGTVSVPTWVANQWYYVECQVVLSDTVGVVIVKINGTTYLNLTNVDTKNGGTASTFDAIGFDGNGNNQGKNLSYDDLYVCNGAGTENNDFLGDVAIETLLPNADGSSSQFAGSDGNSVNNYLLVNESVPSTANYVQDGTSGERDLYGYSNLVRTAGTVFGVQVNSYAQASSESSRPLKNAIKSNATVAASASQALVTTYVPILSVFEQDPDTGAAWTIPAINAAEIGVEVG